MRKLTKKQKEYLTFIFTLLFELTFLGAFAYADDIRKFAAMMLSSVIFTSLAYFINLSKNKSDEEEKQTEKEDRTKIKNQEENMKKTTKNIKTINNNTKHGEAVPKEFYDILLTFIFLLMNATLIGGPVYFFSIDKNALTLERLAILLLIWAILGFMALLVHSKKNKSGEDVVEK